MSERRDDAARAREPVGSGGWREFVSSALLVGAVAAILIAGLLLRADRRGGDAEALRSAPPPPAALPLGSTITPEPAPPASPEPAAGAAAAPSPPATPASEVRPAATEPVADPHLEALATRASVDVDRLRKARGPWTAQLLVACKKETVERAVAAAGPSPKLYVLPADVRGESCFRVCWGAYANAKDAAAAADRPSALRGKDKVAAVEIAKVLP